MKSVKNSKNLQSRLDHILYLIDSRLGLRLSHNLNNTEEEKSPEESIAMTDYFWLGWYRKPGIAKPNNRSVKIMVLENGWIYVDHNNDISTRPIRKKYDSIKSFFEKRLELIKFLIE